MRIACISDTHLFHQRTSKELQAAWASSLKHCDAVVHAGDFTGRGTIEEVASAAAWFRNLLPPIKLTCGGNHDFFFETNIEKTRELFGKDVTILINEPIEIQGVKIWASPVTPFFHDWAFNVPRGAQIRKYWDKIPDNLDILVTHGPPHGILDRAVEGHNCGCEELLDVVLQKQPKYHVFGHVHEGFGTYKLGNTTFINASSLDRNYKLSNYPIIIEI